MRKYSVFVLILALIAALTGCQSGDVSHEPEEQITVTVGNEEFTARRGGYSWNTKGTSVIACGRHVLQSKDDLEPVVLDSKLSTDGAVEVSLTFITPPDTMTLTCWTGDSWDNTGAAPVDEKKLTPTWSEDGTCQLELRYGNYIYELTAIWNKTDSYGGEVQY